MVGEENKDLPPVEIPKFKILRALWRRQEQDEAEKKRVDLEKKIEAIEDQMRTIQQRMKVLNQFTREATNKSPSVSQFPEDLLENLANLVARSGSVGIVGVANKFLSEYPGVCARRQVVSKIEEIAQKEKREEEGDTSAIWHIRKQYVNLIDQDTKKFLQQLKDERLRQIEETKEKKRKENDPSERTGAPGPDGDILDFPAYDGQQEPKPNKKAFTLFCNSIRKEVKSALPPEKRKNKEIVHRILRQRWDHLSDEDYEYWDKIETWDEKRFIRDNAIYAKVQSSSIKAESKISGPPKKRPLQETGESKAVSIPKKRNSQVN
jgi:hypothetical protein